MREKELTTAEAPPPGLSDRVAAEKPARSMAHLGLREALALATVIGRVAGCYAALAAVLLFLRSHINQLLAAVARHAPMPPMRTDVVAWRTEPPTQARSYVLVVVVVAVAVLAHALLVRLLRRWPLVLLAVEVAFVGVAYSMASSASPFLGHAFLLLLVPACALAAPYALPSRQPAERIDVRAPLAVALALQAVPLAWSAWITTFALPVGAIVGAQLAVWSFSIWRSTSARTRSENEVLAGIPFTLLPVVGLLRAPSIGWLFAALVLYGFLRLALGARAVRAWLAPYVRRAPMMVVDVAVVASFLGTCALFTIPYRFRDLPRLNHNSHETTAYGAVNSILHGKMMMADAGLIYGPLRSYALTLYMLVAGMTAEQVRLGQAVINHVSLAILLALGWRLVDRRALALVWFAYLLLVGTVVQLWVNYGGTGMNAFGWADLGRLGLPFLATVGGLTALPKETRDYRLSRQGAIRLAGWGVLAGVATLWAQEFGACAILALVLVPFAHFLLARGPLGVRARVAVASVASFGAGIGATLGLCLTIYALRGRAGVFLGNITENSALFASGSFGSLPFPATEATFLRWESLTGWAPHEGLALEYITPVAIYLFTAALLSARGLAFRWRDRDTVTLGVLLFGFASFRFALGRTDWTHLATVTLPAVVLLPRLVVEGSRAIYVSRAVTRVLRACAACAGIGLALASLNLTGIQLSLSQRLGAMLSGSERPSSGPAYSYPGVPRAGDTKIQPEYIALVQAIDANSSPADKIFQHIGYMDGGEVYFLANRSNPTRFDLLTEFLTTGRQKLALDELIQDPPKLVVGDDWGMIGPDVSQYLKDNYHSLGKFGGWDLMARNP